ncbi:MAG: lytic transglycosylase domain-containing protein [Anaerotignum sp.]
MIRFIKKLFTLAVSLALLAAFGYCVVLPRVLPLKYQDMVEKYAKQYQLEESLVYGVIFCESRFDPEVVSSAEAVGLMQVTKETGFWAAAQMGLDPHTIDLTDPDTNIRIGCWYLHWLNEKFDGVEDTALAGYNAGHGNVAKWLADEEMSRDGITLDEIPYEETKSYVKRVELAERIYRFVYRLQ